jgi:hypothetical protein
MRMTWVLIPVCGGRDGFQDMYGDEHVFQYQYGDEMASNTRMRMTWVPIPVW